MKRLLLMLIASLVLAACNPLDRRTKAGLQVITADVSASLFLDGQYLDRSPYIGKNIQPGSYTLKIEPEDPSLVPYETPITLNKGLLTVVTWKPGKRPEQSGGVVYEMEKLNNKNSTELSIVTIPDGAILNLQGQEKQFAPVTLTDLEPGQREFEVSLPSYDTQKHAVNLVKGHRTTITVKLAKSETIEVNMVTPGSAPTPSPSPSPTLNPKAGGTRLATASAQSSPAATSAGTQSPITGPRVKINSTNFFHNGQEVLRVRDSTGNAGRELGFAPVGREYKYLELTESGWHRIEFEGKPGWVSGQFSTVIK